LLSLPLDPNIFLSILLLNVLPFMRDPQVTPHITRWEKLRILIFTYYATKRRTEDTGQNVASIIISSSSFQGLGLWRAPTSQCPSLSWTSHISSTFGVIFEGDLWNFLSIHS
jgi:hypothetical protein